MHAALVKSEEDEAGLSGCLLALEQVDMRPGSSSSSSSSESSSSSFASSSTSFTTPSLRFRLCITPLTNAESFSRSYRSSGPSGANN
ncbi:hypothetical protein PCANC_01345 [Puccinia coronata f. sp. avenae]|uniref:Uncharacterized protein n=1 Tax=Puccinia coronata f. sp. avenae TaxID=200324 RepID=A0A2N5W697_9BASI|nr:hypothetical protein PCANC_17885 [Puccinia coronata f. sp. avenae]PLW50834.1 hypothetical protein PCASD_01175 [Puccinia coronata f. sp. avenae]PLW57767.1 hypothetical protein PCANC_01345 [Puccinia coronata f. sp. avenae]